MSYKKLFENQLIRFFSLKRNSKSLLVIYFFFSFFIFDLSKANDNNFNSENKSQIQIDYLDSKKELDDYILDSGDELYIDFYPAVEFNSIYPVSPEGELFLPRLDETFVRGLTTSELEKLLEKRYSEYIINPKIQIRIVGFKEMRILVQGAVRNPGLYKFPVYRTNLFSSLQNQNDLTLQGNNLTFGEKNPLILNNLSYGQKNSLILNNQELSQRQNDSNNLIVKRSNETISTISDAIRKSGGITSKTDLSKISITRDIPLGKGGGQKRAIIDFTSFLEDSNPENDIRLYDGDKIFLPELPSSSNEILPKSILTGLSPRFIRVNIFGRVETPGSILLPLEATLSDAIDLTGPIRPLSGKIVLIRYNEDGTILKKKISYSRRAKRGSRRNPFIKEGDLISVTNSLLGRSTGIIREFTAPFVDIYSTKEILNSFD